MAGVTDAPFRKLAWEHGAGYVVGEMVSVREDLWHTDKSTLRRRAVAGIRPQVVQIAGADPALIAAGAERHWRDGADIIDINFGCPAKKVCRKAAGSALLADERLVARIIAAAVAAVPVPVTVKIRTGFSPERRNGVAIARIAEAEGAQAIAVHGRTRACRFEGAAEYATISAIKAAVRVPVFANGDVASVEKAREVRAMTGADGVMIGRGALGSPWLLGQIAGVTAEPDLNAKLAIVQRHVADMHAFYGAAGVRIARKHLRWYLDKLHELGPAELRRDFCRRFNQSTDPAEQLDLLAGLSLARAA